MARRTLYLLRHGQYQSTTTPQEEPDGALTPLGQQQAAAAGERLRSLPIQAIHHSTAQRGVETAAILAACFQKPR